MTSEPDVTVAPASRAGCEDLQAVFGARGAASICRCQRYKLRPRESFAAFSSRSALRPGRRQ